MVPGLGRLHRWFGQPSTFGLDQRLRHPSARTLFIAVVPPSISIRLRMARILAALALAAVWPWLSGLVSGEIGEAKKSDLGRGIAIADAAAVRRLRYRPLQPAQKSGNATSNRVYTQESPRRR